MPIYLDHQATTPVDPQVAEIVTGHLRETFGNPASTQHAHGHLANGVVERAREVVAREAGASYQEVVFTSGATESNNLALRGFCMGQTSGRTRIISVETEHPSVLETLRMLESDGFEVVLLKPDNRGILGAEKLAAVIDHRTLLVSVSLANSEVGATPELPALSEIARRHGALFHTDAAQGFGKIALGMSEMGLDLVSVSGHKLYGPKGIGALVIGRSVRHRMHPLIFGGGQERGARSGTLNVPGIAGLAAAVELAASLRPTEPVRLRRLAVQLQEHLLREFPDAQLNSPSDGTGLPGLLNIRLPGVDAQALIANCPEVAFSAGSACSQGTVAPSHVLIAMGLSEAAADESVRIGIGRFTTEAEVHDAATAIAAAARLVLSRQGVAVR